MGTYTVASLEELKSEVRLSFDDNNPLLIIKLIHKEGTPAALLREFHDELLRLSESFRIVDIKIETLKDFDPPVELPGDWNGRALTYNIIPQWWAVVRAEEKAMPDPYQLTLYFPVIEIEGRYGFSGAVVADRPNRAKKRAEGVRASPKAPIKTGAEGASPRINK